MTWDGRFDDDEAASNECPPAGKYLVEVVAAERTTSRNTGDGMLSVEMKIAEGRFQGHKLWDNFMMTGKGAGIGSAKAKAFGISLKKGDAVNEWEFVGRRAFMWGRQEKYKGFLNLKSDIEQGDYCGYDPLSPNAPDGVDAPGVEETDIPF